MNFWVNWNN